MSTTGVPSNTCSKNNVQVARADGRGCLTRSEPPVRLGPFVMHGPVFTPWGGMPLRLAVSKSPAE
jgi:hypothetical protein